MVKMFWVMALCLVGSNSFAQSACDTNYSNVATAVANCLSQVDTWSASVSWPRTVESIDGDTFISYICRHHWIDGSPYTYDYLPNLLKTCYTMKPGPLPAPPPPQDPQCSAGSIIHIEAKAVGERIPIVGAPFSLLYFSYWSQNRSNDYAISATVSTGTVRSNTTGFDVKLYNEVGTLIDHQTYSALPNLTYSYSWNGLDASGNPSIGLLKYKLVLQELATDFSPSVAKDIAVGALKSKLMGLGGWLPSNWVYYDAASQRLLRGDGSTRSSVGTAVSGGWRVAEYDGSRVYYFDSLGRLTNIVTPYTGTVIGTFAYDSSGHIASYTEPFGRVTTFNYSSGILSTIVAPNGKTTSFTVDSNGYLASATNPLSETYLMTYINANGLLSTFTKPNSAVSTFTYNSVGELVSDSHSGGFSSTFGVSGSYQTLTSAMGRVKKELQSVSLGMNLQTVTQADGSLDEIRTNTTSIVNNFRDASYTKNFSSNPRFVGQAKVLSTTDTRDWGVRSASWTHSASLSNSSDPFSITTLVDKETLSGVSPAPEYTSTYTGATKTWVDKTKLNRTKTRVWDNYERLISFQKGSQTATTYSYANELLTQTTRGSRTMTMAYDPTSKLLTSVTDALGQTTSYAYDSAERMVSQTLPDLRVIGYQYDSQGNLVQITPPGKPVHGFTFNSKELNSGYQPPPLDFVNNWNTTYTYNNDKQLTQITRPDGQTINYNYNSVKGNLDSTTGSFGTYAETYDGSANPLRTTAPDNTYITRSYNYSGLVGLNYFTSSGVSISKYFETADATSKVSWTRVTDSAGTAKVVNYSYDNDEYLILAGDISMSYDIPDGKLTGSSLSTLTDSYSYNTYGEMTGYTASISGTPAYTLTLTRDALGRISQKIEGMNGVTNTFDYTYDTTGRLIQVNKNSVTVSTYVYDNNSNRTGGSINGTTTSATYDDQDRMLTYNVNSYVYNRNGELQSKTDTVLSQTTNYTYDVFGQLTSVALPSSTINYEIDPLHKRWGRKVGSTVQTRYVRDNQGRIVAEMNGSNIMTRRYIYATKSHVPDYFFDMANEKYRIFTDHLGSVRLVVKLSTGTVMQMMEHDEFGRAVQDTNPGYQPFGFAGGEYDSATGLVRFGVRDYDPVIGRWTSKDPILFKGGDMNLFGYTANDPVNKIDPNGKTAYVLCVTSTFWDCLRKEAEVRSNKCEARGSGESAGEAISNGFADGNNCAYFAASKCIDPIYNPQPQPPGI